MAQRLTFQQFFQLTEKVRELRDQLRSSRPTMLEACKLLGDKLGFAVSDKNLAKACQATGIRWRSRQEDDRGETLEVLVRAVLELARLIDWKPPQELLQLRKAS